MRNLKRVLSLGLASVMLLGMMVIGAGAADKTYADITDKGDIKNVEAVSLLVDLGIIEGKPDGSYAPNEIVDRATMAKLICYLLMGNVDQTAFAGTKTDLTDVDGQWAEGYIKYCYANGIISGDGQGHFYPTREVTVVEAAKMLNVALGYNAETQGYVSNPNWSVNIMRDAATSGLTAGVDATTNQGLTRDNAAQMIFNALMAKQVYYADLVGSSALYRDNTLGEASYGLVKKEGVITAVGSDTVTLTNASVSVKGGTFKTAGSWTDIGKTGFVYVQCKTTNSGGLLNPGVSVDESNILQVYSSQVVVADTVLGSSTNGTSISDLSNSSKAAYIAGIEDGAKYYVNGVEVTATAAAAENGYFVADKVVKYGNTSSSADVNGKGVTVSFIDNDKDGSADVITLIVPTATKVATYSTTGDGKVTFTPAIDGTWTSKNVVGFENIARNDYVTGVVYGGKLYVEKADVVSGKVTAKNASKGTVTVDGTDYELAKNTAGSLAVSDFDVTDELSLYVDANGYVIAKGDVISSTPANYLYVMDNDPSTMAGTQAKVVFTDGTTEVITVNKVGTSTADAEKGDLKGAYTYTVSDGKYNLSTKLSGDLATGGDVAYTVKNGEVGVTTAGSSATTMTGKFANNNTIFVDAVNGKAYVGYKNLPGTVKFTAGTVIYDADTANLMKIVFMSAGTTASSTVTDEVFIYAYNVYTETADSSNNKLFTYDAVVNGEVTTITVTETMQSTIDADGVYSITSRNSDGVVTGLDSKTDASAKAAVVYIGGDVMIYNTNKSITFNEDTIFIEVDTTKDSASVVDANSIIVDSDVPANTSNVIVTATSGDANVAQYIYIVK